MRSGCSRFVRPAAAAVALVLGIATGLAGDLQFHADADGGFQFDTGTLRGGLHLKGKSLGLQQLVHAPTGLPISAGNGLLNVYRVFSRGQRYGVGAWDWPSTATLEENGARLRVAWPEATGRPFALEADYRIVDAATVDVTTTVRARADLPAFEAFVASYFAESFTNAAVGRPGPTWVAATRDLGDWQIHPRSGKDLPVIQDGRWKMEPNPVAWIAQPPFGASALARRRSPGTGVSALLMARPDTCFAIAMPHETEGHRSLYLSLFGGDLHAGDEARGTVRFTWAATDAEVGTRVSGWNAAERR